jgi:uncharacterized protein (UPF0332 family)
MPTPDWKEWLKDKEKCRKWLNFYFKNNQIKKKTNESIFYLKKTDHNLKLANWLYEKHENEIPKLFKNESFYDWIINMYYYSIYHSILALISKEGYESKSHYASLCFIIYNNYYQKKNLSKDEINSIGRFLTKEDIELIGFSKELRERASYNVHEDFEKDLAEKIRINAINLINKIKSLVNK